MKKKDMSSSIALENIAIYYGVNGMKICRKLPL